MCFPSITDSMINRFLIPLAVPLLLFDSDLKRVINDTGTLLTAFGVGAVATIVGTIVTFPIIPLNSLGPDMGWRVACALAARHIGGAINFVAVAETLQIHGSVVSAASKLVMCDGRRVTYYLTQSNPTFSNHSQWTTIVAADNVVVALYFAFLFSIAEAGEPNESSDKDDTVEGASATIAEVAIEENRASSISLPSLMVSLSVASTLVSCGMFLTKSLLPAGTSALPLISMLTVAAATVFPAFFSRISETGTALGVAFIQMFFAASGAAGSIKLVLQQAPSLFAFSALQIGVHFATLMAIGRTILRLPNRELYLASNANVGGPTTAAAMAQAKECKRLVLPALLIGIFGYATATAIALSLGPILLRLPTLVG
jgi:uncharacterized membrane protein